ncbi:MAG: S-layer homology domain-containing protein [Clostridia bacterium]|nr:S-layer homology domain-containing protein [Clostridia bacterium]
MKNKLISAMLFAVIMLGALTLPIGAFRGSGIEVLSEGVEVVKTGIFGKRIAFRDTDFKCAFAIDDFNALRITRLPSSTEGTLLLANRRVREGQEIKRKNVAALIFVPASGEIGESSFGFSIDGSREYTARLRFVDRVNLAPTAKESDGDTMISTQESIGIWGRLEASDPEGDGLEYMIVAYPKSGTVRLTDAEGGYSYTPCGGFTGYDSFTWVARDEYGNYTAPVEVMLKVTERMSEIVYRDMIDRKEYNAAVAMSAMGVMSGRLVGDDFYFEPEKTVTRAEFLAMALKASGIRPIGTQTFFDDNSEIPASLRGYVNAAARRGIVDGEHDGTRLTLSPMDNISVWEAASIMCGIVGKGSGEAAEYSTLSDIPVSARGDVEAMMTLGVLDEDSGDMTRSVTRADAAEFLYRLVNNS